MAEGDGCLLTSTSFLRVVGINFIRWNFQSVFLLHLSFLHPLFPFAWFSWFMTAALIFFAASFTHPPHTSSISTAVAIALSNGEIRFVDSIIGNLLRFPFDTAGGEKRNVDRGFWTRSIDTIGYGVNFKSV